MDKSFGQFCPVALSSEILCQKWMLLIVRELLAGCSRFNTIKKGIPKISSTLLKQRLETLFQAEILVKKRANENSPYEYYLTEAGQQLKPVLTQIGEWGQRWAREIKPDDLDPGWLVWNIHRRLNLNEIPATKTILHIEFTDAKKNEKYFWLVIDAGNVDVCLKNPGFDVDLKVTTTVRTLAEIWRGIKIFKTELKAGTIKLEGKTKLTKTFPKWLLLSVYAPIKNQR